MVHVKSSLDFKAISSFNDEKCAWQLRKRCSLATLVQSLLAGAYYHFSAQSSPPANCQHLVLLPLMTSLCWT